MPSVEERIRELPCVEWTKARTEHGYGRQSVNGRLVYAHRVAWEKANGPIPDGLLVLHRCDNPACVNVDHLFLGTQRDNMRDASRKGRLGPQRYPAEYAKRCRSGPGEENGHAKLTWAKVDALRERYASGGVSQKELALEVGIDRGHMNRILKGTAWVRPARFAGEPEGASRG